MAPPGSFLPTMGRAGRPPIPPAALPR